MPNRLHSQAPSIIKDYELISLSYVSILTPTKRLGIFGTSGFMCLVATCHWFQPELYLSHVRQYETSWVTT